MTSTQGLFITNSKDSRSNKNLRPNKYQKQMVIDVVLMQLGGPAETFGLGNKE